MELTCFGELASLEKVAIVAALVLALVLFVLGLILAFRPGLWKGTIVRVVYDKISFGVPAPLACIVLGVGLAGVTVWWLSREFPAHSLSFSQKPWTLSEIKERLEHESRVRIELRGETASFSIDKDFSGACVSDVITSICDYYPTRLRCQHPNSNTFIIEKR